jgi:multiple sugar transport system permease protein
MFSNTKRTTIIPKVLLSVLIILLIAWSIIPLLFAIVLSFSGPVLPTKSFLPEEFSIGAYKNIIIDDSILPYLKNSFYVALIACLITIPISTLAGYSFSRMKVRWFNLFFYLFIVFRMIPYITTVLPTFSLMQKVGLMDTHLGIGLIHSLWLTPLAVWLMKGYFDMVPKELEEAAFIDGAGYFTTLFKIILPLSIIGIIVSTLFVFLYSYIEFMYALIISRHDAMTIPIKLASYSSEGKFLWREMMAASLVSTIPMIILFAFLQRHIASGLTFGAIKE